MDFSRLRDGEVAAGLGGIALFVFMFFDWYGGGGAFGEGGGLSGWDALSGDVTGFLIALTAVAGVALALLAITGRKVNVPLPRGCGTAALGSLSVAIILWRMLADPVGAELKIGIFLGFLAAVAVAVGAIVAMREDGFEPLVAVPGGRTRAASGASAPAAKPATRSTTRRKTTARKKTTPRKRATGSRSKSSGGTKRRSSGGGRRSSGSRKQ